MPLDDELKQLLAQRPDQAIKQIFHQYYPMMVGTSFNICQKEDVSKDIAQEVLLKLWENHQTISINSSLKNYLKRATINHTINYLKSKHGNKNYEEVDRLNILDEQTLQKLEAEDLEAFIRESISELPERCRIVFTLSRFEDLSNKEIAEQLGISVKTVESQITKALKFLRKQVLPHIRHGMFIFSLFQWPV
ncbi:MAG: RNA polymerase sigma-70 factor [Saprospiraceae bacterium]|nr:RNA polymerase sigma-70 factor [Saprospiraceae bacterium]